VLIENRIGAGGNIATEAVVTSPPDGYTLRQVSSTNARNTTLYEKLKFIFHRDIAPVASVMHVPNVIDVNPSVPVKTVSEFIAYAKANPGKVNMASGGVGSGNHLSGELFKIKAGVNLTHVPYRGEGTALPDLLGGQVQVMSTLPSSIEYIRAGKLRPLAVTTATRSDALPDISTVGEFLLGYEASSWYGVGAPKATPSEVIEAQQGCQRRSRRSQVQTADCPAWQYGVTRLAYRLRETHLRGNREVGQSDPGGPHQGGVNGIRLNVP
jgi:tripartite-type tricarboxylate transporter receptor subunit TctC